MPEYDQDFDPPAPLGMVGLRNLEKNLVTWDVPMLIDSGADLTLVPKTSVEQIGAEPALEVYELSGFDGSTFLSRPVNLDLSFMKRAFRGRYLVLDRDYGILGRDILNQMGICLDGPRLTWGLMSRDP